MKKEEEEIPYPNYPHDGLFGADDGYDSCPLGTYN